MSAHITIGENGFSLPLEIATQSIAILAKRGVGKSYTAAVLVEELFHAGVPTIVIDPTGAHWGLKSSSTGKRQGLPFVVFGGEHQDLPLEDGAGSVIAAAIVENRFPAVIDLSLFRKRQSARFLADFMETLYLKNRTALHLVCDEADAYAPQKPFDEEARTLGAMEDIVRRGRIKGIGCTLITQRPAVINKNVLTQCEVVIALRMVHPRDIEALMEWVNVQADPVKARDMTGALPSMPVGQAWVWWPAGNIFSLVDVRERKTFDSGATPKPGEKRIDPERFADIDLNSLGTAIQQTVQRAKENDPKELKAKIATLQRQVAELEKRPEKQVTVERQVPVMQPADRELLEAVSARALMLVKRFDDLTPVVSQVSVSRPMPAPVVTQRAISVPYPKEAGDETLSGAGRRILTVLAQHPSGKGADSLACLAGYTNNGYFRNTMGALRTYGFVNRGQPIQITPAGRSALGHFDPLPTGDALKQYWLAQLDDAKRRILTVLFNIYPQGTGADRLAEAAGYTNNGYFRNTMGRLRTMGLVEGYGSETKAAAVFFE